MKLYRSLKAVNESFPESWSLINNQRDATLLNLKVEERAQVKKKKKNKKQKQKFPTENGEGWGMDTSLEAPERKVDGQV